MLISELIAELSAMREKAGDLDVYVQKGKNDDGFFLLESIHRDIVVNPQYEKGKSEGKLIELLILEAAENE